MSALNIAVLTNPAESGTLAILPQLLDALNSVASGGQIDYMAYWFTEVEVYEALKAARDRGAAVRILFDKHAAPSTGHPHYAPIAQMAHFDAMDFRFDKLHAAMHAKLAIMTPYTVFIGSMNTTVAGDERNAEVMLQLTNLDDPLHTAAYALLDDFFQTHWDHSEPYS